MTILITGASGFMGTKLVRYLALQGRDVVAHDLVPPRPASILADVASHVKVEMGNITDLSNLLHVVKRNNVEGIIHLAAIPGSLANARPVEALQVNVIGTANILETSRIMGLKRVIVCSTAAVMGTPEDVTTPRKEDQYSLPLSSIYSMSKLTCEQLTYMYRGLYKVDAIAVRPRMVYGPGERHVGTGDSPMWALVADAMAGRPIRYETGGDTADEYTYIKDFNKGVVQAYDYLAPKYWVYNLSFGQSRTVSQICDVLRRVFPGLPIEVGPGQWRGFRKGEKGGKQADVSYRIWLRPPQDNTRAREDFGYKPEWDLDRAIPDWIRCLKEGKWE